MAGIKKIDESLKKCETKECPITALFGYCEISLGWLSQDGTEFGEWFNKAAAQWQKEAKEILAKVEAAGKK